MTQHKTTLDVTENLATSLKVECIAAGTNLTEVCRDAGVNRSTVQRWMEAEPKTWVEIRKILKAINDRRHSKNK